ncbi:protein mitoshell-like isoform X2 [Episyrphus balteatus]|uniref:protein mitoshell-like isoform X2 n=1 Tax=Episyrphus balteatus TaxID=286459 RepID=UPI0024868331|nr:protein mitoshell-like isoform X2 [Episyrphus balteatus]
MFETKLPRKIIGMQRKPIINTSYTPEALDEFLHGYKGAYADEVRKEQTKWPPSLVKDINYIWPSQVILQPSSSNGQTITLDVKSYRNDNSNQTSTKSLNQIDHVNDDSMNCRRLSALEISKNFERLKVKTKAPQFPTTSSLETHKNDQSNIKQVSDEKEKLTTSHDSMKALCLSCADDGEKIARIHCYRPFFKKIDGLCDRIKQDLIHHDSVIPHINSHGNVWAIKDLVFVCTRIINAWNITRGYVYDPSEGLNKVRSSLNPDFIPSFVAWQEATSKFIENLMMSFLSLDIWVHTPNNTLKRLEFQKKLDAFMESMLKQTKSCYSTQRRKNQDNQYWEQCGCDPCKMVLSSQSTHDALLELCIVCTEYGEKVAQNYNSRAFFKKIDTLCSRTRFELMHCDNALSNLNSQGIVWAIKELIFSTTRIINAWNIAKSYVYDSSEGLDKVRAGLSGQFVSSFNTWQETTKVFLENSRMSFIKLDNLAHIESNNFKKDDASKLMKVFKDQLQQLKSSEVFFRTLFCRNYFPDFIEQTPDFLDIRSIVNKLHNGGYGHIFEVVHDVRFTINQVKKYLMRNIDPNLDRAVNDFQADVEKILAQKTFKKYQFDHIEGRPNEILLYYNI